MKKYYILIILISAYLTFPAYCESINAKSGEADSDLSKELQKQVELAKIYARQKGPRFTVIGQVSSERGGLYSVNGETFAVNKETHYEGRFRTGAFAEISGPLSGGTKVADMIIVHEITSSSSSDDKGMAKRER